MLITKKAEERGEVNPRLLYQGQVYKTFSSVISKIIAIFSASENYSYTCELHFEKFY